MLKIFIDNEWVDYVYQRLYEERGYTSTPSLSLLAYDDSMVQIEAWLNAGLVWAEPDRRWYPQDAVPYYVYQNVSETLYRIGERRVYPEYRKEQERYVLDGSAFTTVQDLHDNEGITATPSIVWAVDSGVPWAWYNPEERLYFDDSRKEWTSEPPAVAPGGGEIIIPFPDPILPFPQWEYDLSQLPSIQSVTGAFYPAVHPAESALAFKCWPQWEQGTEPMDLYPDITERGITLYVYPESGASDYMGTHYAQGAEFMGSYQEVWVDADSEATLYRGASPYIYGTSHDTDNPLLYFVSYQYYTPQEMHSFGYTESAGVDIEVFDPRQLPISGKLWSVPQDLYFTEDHATIAIEAGTAYPLYYGEGTRVPYSDWAGTVFGPLVGRIARINGVLAIVTGVSSIPLSDLSLSDDNGYLAFTCARSMPDSTIGIRFEWGGALGSGT